jgi:phosphohistidine phosphatase SixA
MMPFRWRRSSSRHPALLGALTVVVATVIAVTAAARTVSAGSRTTVGDRFPAAGAAADTIFLVRHAERADMVKGAPPAMAADPGLSAAGQARAASLAAMLKDAGISAIFVTEFKRTRETAAPLAKTLGITPATIAADDAAKLVAELKQVTGNALVVGHSNTVPDVIKALGVSARVAIGDEDFDNLFIVTAGQPPRFARLHYR